MACGVTIFKKNFRLKKIMFYFISLIDYDITAAP